MSISTSGIQSSGSFDPSKLASNLVKKLDANQDGSLDKTEFVNGLTSVGVSADDATKQFDSIDTQKSGKITEADIEASIKQGPGEIPPSSGAAAAKSGNVASTSSAESYDKMDTNKDGTVSGMEELVYELSHQALTTTNKSSVTSTQDIGQNVDVSA
jgi:Ca2+-binding EF-hand superfamily protein